MSVKYSKTFEIVSRHLEQIVTALLNTPILQTTYIYKAIIFLFPMDIRWDIR